MATKIELEQQVGDLEDALESIFDQASSTDPDLSEIRELAASALDIEEPGELEEGEDED